MDNQTVTENISNTKLEDVMQGVLDILEADDRMSFEEKKKSALEYLNKTEKEMMSEILVKATSNDISGEKIKNVFWALGEHIKVDDDISLRRVTVEDKDNFFDLQRHYSVCRSLLKEEAYRDLIWKEHAEEKALSFSIINNGVYIGYCGINDTTRSPWEIAIEILPDWTSKGIGYKVIPTMLHSIKTRLGISEFRIRIDSFNYPSQKLFEKLGAVPNGISVYMLHDENERRKLEESNLHLIDDKLISVADKFEVSPRELLSHVLEYKLSYGS